MKVQLLKQPVPDFFKGRVRHVTSTLPFYEREDGGYVHRLRSAWMHYDDDGKYRHTSYHFWCGQLGSTSKKKKGRLTDEPSSGRVVCATCQARAHGSGQVGTGKLGDEFVRFRPRPPFFGRKVTK